MGVSELRLRPLRPEDEPAVRAAQAEFGDAFEFAIDLRPDTEWTAYVALIERMHAGVDVPVDRVPGTFLLAEVDGELVGRASVRHVLNDWLLAHGGHIGYGVLPPQRGRGYAREILRQSLIIARAHGVDAALLTADDGNRASIAVIEGAGGRLDPDWPHSDDDPPRRRYWIR